MGPVNVRNRDMVSIFTTMVKASSKGIMCTKMSDQESLLLFVAMQRFRETASLMGSRTEFMYMTMAWEFLKTMMSSAMQAMGFDVIVERMRC